MIRTLDSVEELFWLAQQLPQTQHVTAVRVSGFVQPAVWQAAWESLRPHFPILSAAIRKLPGERPAFVVAGCPAPLYIHPCLAVLDIPREVLSCLNRSIGDGSEALVRLEVYHGAEETVLLLTAHHGAADAISSFFVLEALLATVAGEQVGGQAHWPSLATGLGLSAPGAYAPSSDPDNSNPENLSPDLPGLQVTHLSMTPAETQLLLDRCRREATTVHGALVVAFTQVIARHAERTGQVLKPELQCSTPIDCRSMIESPDASGTLITFPVTRIPTKPRSFWELARNVRKELQEARSREGTLQFLQSISNLVSVELQPQDLPAMMQKGPGFWDLMVTNNGTYRFRSAYPGLRVQSLMTAVASGAPWTQTISVANLDGALGMTQISRQPVPKMLEQVRTVLLTA